MKSIDGDIQHGSKEEVETFEDHEKHTESYLINRLVEEEPHIKTKNLEYDKELS